jgi:hypothetical protein
MLTQILYIDIYLFICGFIGSLYQGSSEHSRYECHPVRLYSQEHRDL